jgi:uncharacterized protein (DUF58 family)
MAVTPLPDASPDPLPNRRFPWRPTREGTLWIAAALVMLFAGWYKLINLLMLLSYMMLSLVVLNAILGRGYAFYVKLQRSRGQPIFAGENATRFITITNNATRNSSVTVFEKSDAHRIEVFVPVLAPGESRKLLVDLSPQRRGKYPTSPMYVIAGYPFGLVNYTVPAEPPDSIIVLPRLGTVDNGKLRRWLIRTGVGDHFSRRVVHRQALQAADVRGLRGYRPGDSPRDIHWRTTAKHAQLMVREYDSTEPLDLLLVVEPWIPEKPTAADLATVEATFELAASLFWSWCHAEEMPQATLAVVGSDIFRTGAANEGFGRIALELLAEAQATSNGNLPEAGLRVRSSRCVRMLVSSRPNSPLAQELRRVSGVPFVTVSPTTRMAWYTPPSNNLKS